MAESILAFLDDRLTEDEAIAGKATAGPWEACMTSHGRCEGNGEVWAYQAGRHVVEGLPGAGDQTFHDAWHAARHDPDRIKAEVRLKRRLIDLVFEYEATVDGEWGCGHTAAQNRAGECWREPLDGIEGLRVLAAVWSGHPEYLAEWAPS